MRQVRQREMTGYILVQIGAEESLTPKSSGRLKEMEVL
jgi:hypothetical protein